MMPEPNGPDAPEPNAGGGAPEPREEADSREEAPVPAHPNAGGEPRPAEGSEVAREVSVRRAPRVSRFLVLGAGLGAVAAYVLTAAFEVDPDVGFGATFGYFALYCIPIGLVLGGIVALVLDRRATRRATTAIAGKLTVRAGDGEEHEARNT